MIRAILFDLDGTLLDRKSSFESFMKDQWERFRTELSGVSLNRYLEAAVRTDCNGTAPRRQAFATMAQDLELSPTLQETLLADYRDRFAGACRLFPGADRTLSDLRGMGFQLGLITNGSESMQGKKLDALDLRSHFDAILISQVEGVHKPEPEIFRRATEKLQVGLHEAAFVGDNPDADIRGSKHLGMRAVWIRNSWWDEPAEADAVLEEVQELLPLVAAWNAGPSAQV